MALDFWKIAMRPGKPLMFGTLGTAAGALKVIGLPGNPVSAHRDLDLVRRSGDRAHAR